MKEISYDEWYDLLQKIKDISTASNIALGIVLFLFFAFLVLFGGYLLFSVKDK